MSDANPVAEAPLDALRDALEAAHTELDNCASNNDAAPGGEEFRSGHWCVQCDESVDRNGEVRAKIRAALAALSAPPPPPREQELLGEEGGVSRDKVRELAGAVRDAANDTDSKDAEGLLEALTETADALDELLAAPSAPPRKAPQEGCKACALVAKEFGTDKCPWCGRPFGTTVGYVEKCSAMHHAVRSAMGLDKPAYDARPSSPEEQLSGKELK